MKTKVLIILCVAILVSCKKNRNSAPTLELKTYLVKTVTVFGTETWSYDAQNKPLSMQFVSTLESSNPSYTYQINSLNSNGAITDAVYDYVSASNIDVRELKTYNNEGKLIRVTSFINATGLSNSYTTYQYLTNEIRTTTYNASNVVTSSTLYTLSADGKNITEIKNYNAAGGLKNRATYSNFDNKSNHTLLYPKGYGAGIISTNNYLTVVYFNAEIGTTNTTNYTFEYNTDGYPTKRIMVGSNTDTFEYIKK